MKAPRDELVLRCYAYEHHGGYRAECIDLDIMVERESLSGTVEALNDAVASYVEAVNERGWTDELIPRPSPLARRLRYHLRTMPWRIPRSLSRLELDRVVTFDNGRVRVA